MTALAHDPERERLQQAVTDAEDAWFAMMRRAEDEPIGRDESAAIGAAMDAAEAALAAYDQARGPTVPTRTAPGYRNQAAPDE